MFLTALCLSTGPLPEATAVSMVTILSLFRGVFILNEKGFRSISCIKNESIHYSNTLMENLSNKSSHTQDILPSVKLKEIRSVLVQPLHTVIKSTVLLFSQRISSEYILM